MTREEALAIAAELGLAGPEADGFAAETPFSRSMDELRTLISHEKTPVRIKDAAAMLPEISEELFTAPSEYDAATGTWELFAGPLQPSDLLLELVAAARASEWEQVGILIARATHDGARSHDSRSQTIA
jgi:hypothetical protein